MLRWSAALIGLGLVAACAATRIDSRSADAAEPGVGAVAVRCVPVALDPDDQQLMTIGKLRYRGGIRLLASDARFGGWSDLRVDDDGAVTLLSDNGYWLSGQLGVDEAGQLTGLNGARLGPLTDLRGKPVSRAQSDAEGLVKLADGGFIVSFEGQHRLWHYPNAEPPFSAPPVALPRPPGLDKAPANGGIEAVGQLADGRLIALVEDLYDGAENVGWLGDQKHWERISYRAAPDFKPTSAAGLPNGDLVVLERRFSIFGGFAGRLVRVRAADIAPGRHLIGEELARFERPYIIDNYEGVAVARDGGGRLRLYIVSDDNYQRLLQETLLLSFELVE